MSPEVDKALDTANNVVSALKTSPAMLSLVILQVVTFGGIMYAVTTNSSYLRDERKAWAEYQKQVTELLARCVVPNR